MKFEEFKAYFYNANKETQEDILNNLWVHSPVRDDINKLVISDKNNNLHFDPSV